MYKIMHSIAGGSYAPDRAFRQRHSGKKHAGGRKVKTTNLFIWPLLLLFMAQSVFAQSLLEKKVTLEADNISLSQLFRLLKEKTGVNFVYNAEEAARAGTVTVHVKDQSLKKVLDTYLSAGKLAYEVSDKNILIFRKAGTGEAGAADPGVEREEDRTHLVSGKITDDKGVPLAGATVQVKGTGASVLADEQGHFEISVSGRKAVLLFSHIGYVSVAEPVGRRPVVAVQLHSGADKDLDKVVVVGYGTVRKREVTGSIASIGAEKLADRPVQSFDQALAGKAAGVKVYLPNGVLNNPPVVRIRGTNSISLSSSPLYIVDGIPINSGQVSPESNITNNPLADINPSDIESVDILKDAASTAIYGSRAAAGVVLITTKRGKAGKAKVNYNGWASVTKAVRLPGLLDAQQYMDLKNEAVLNLKELSGNANNSNVASKSFFPSYHADGSLIDTRWYDITYQTGLSHNHSVDVSGGTDAIKYFFSANYSDQNGFIRKDEFRRVGVRFNIEDKVTSWLKLSGGLNYTRNNNLSPNTGGLPKNALLIAGLGRLATATAPNVAALKEDGSYNVTGNAMGMGANTVVSNLYNPKALLDLNRYTSQSDHIIANINAEVNILPGLYYKMTYGVDYNKIENNDFESPVHGPGYAVHGDATNALVNIDNWNWTNSLNYFKTIGQHSLTLLGGYDVQRFSQNQWGAVMSNVADPYYTTFEGSFGALTPLGNYAIGTDYDNQWGYLSLFSRLNYDYAKRYFFTVNFRRDGNSVLGLHRKYGNFGGVSAGWSVSDESFYKGSVFGQIVNSLKLRGSWGKVGNGNITNRYAALNLYSSGLYGAAPTLNYYQAGNPDLGWETSYQTNAGLDLGFLKDRLQVQVSYFHNNVNDLILNSPQTSSKGIPGNSIALNVGSLYNRGWELSLNAGIINSGKFQWDASFNFSALKNRVKALAQGNIPIVGVTHVANETNNITKVGYSVGSLYGAKTDGVNPDNGRQIFINKSGKQVQYSYAVTAGQSNWSYLDGTVAPAITSDDYYVLGNALPTWFGGFSNNFRYGGFDLNLNFTYSGGNYIQNGTRATLLDARFYNNSKEALSRWTQPGQHTSVPRPIYGDVISSGNSFPISANVQKADFVRLESVSLGYTLPGRYFGAASGISSLRVYASVFNALLFTKYKGYDPEVSSNGDSNVAPSVDRNAVPQARSYTLGVNLTF